MRQNKYYVAKNHIDYWLGKQPVMTPWREIWAELRELVVQSWDLDNNQDLKKNHMANISKQEYINASYKYAKRVHDRNKKLLIKKVEQYLKVQGVRYNV